MATVDLAALQPFIDQKYIGVQRHPFADLYIYNYTPKAQFDRVWTPETKVCRGLILDSKGTIVQRSFPKFFNLDEVEARGEKIPLEPFEVFDKIDGSLGILYHDLDGPSIATRGSFISEQAKEATNIFYGKYGNVPLEPELTYLFEIVYPGNRIVVNYGDMRDLILLTIIETETGQEWSYERIVETYGHHFLIARRYDGITDLAQIAAHEEENREGFVIRFAGGYRVKAKFAEYKRLHKLLTGISARSIWECLANSQPIDPLLDRVPDEFYSWVRATAQGLTDQYEMRLAAAYSAHSDVATLPARKDQALALADSDVRSIVFRMLDGKPYEELIWKEIRPEAERPFKVDE